MFEAGMIDVVDDDDALSDALVRLLRSMGYAGRAYANVAEWLGAEREDVPSCLLLDVRLPGVSGLELLSGLGARGIARPVIMMTGHADVPMSVQAMKAGAVDFLTKPFREQDLLDAVARALEHDRRRLAEEAARQTARVRHASLTRREQEVFQGILDGLTNREIAARLGLSPVTVKAHRGSLHRKMGVAGVPELVRHARLLGLG
jgi:FixJ family two-component response regulator